MTDYEGTLECVIGELAQARDLLSQGGLERHHDRLRQAQARNRELLAVIEDLRDRLSIYESQAADPSSRIPLAEAWRQIDGTVSE